MTFWARIFGRDVRRRLNSLEDRVDTLGEAVAELVKGKGQ